MEPSLARDFKLVRESADRAEARQVIVSALYDQIDAGLIIDRTSMVAFFEDTGFEVTRQAAKSISVRDPEFSKPFKLEGVLTHENWSQTRHAEIAAEYEADADANRATRLDGISHDNLRADLADHVERRAEYNEERSAHFLFHNRNLFEERIELIKNWMTFSPWIITGIIVTGIALMMVASWLWTVQLTRSELTELGLTRIDWEDATWLVLDPTTTRVRTCTLGGRSVTCIKIEED